MRAALGALVDEEAAVDALAHQRKVSFAGSTDADLDRAAATSPMSVFADADQDCCARSRTFVERPVFEAFVERFIAGTKAIVVEDPQNDRTQSGRSCPHLGRLDKRSHPRRGTIRAP